MRFNIRLESVKTRTELANELGIDVIKALDLVKLNSDVTCTTNGCSLPSTQSNHNRCILCQQSEGTPDRTQKKGGVQKLDMKHTHPHRISYFLCGESQRS